MDDSTDRPKPTEVCTFNGQTDRKMHKSFLRGEKTVVREPNIQWKTMNEMLMGILTKDCTSVCVIRAFALTYK